MLIIKLAVYFKNRDIYKYKFVPNNSRSMDHVTNSASHRFVTEQQLSNHRNVYLFKSYRSCLHA